MMPNKTIVLCVFSVLASILTGLGMTESERTFLWNEANAIMASARSAEDHMMAAQVYQDMLDKGIRNGLVFYNMGTALLNAGVYDGAIEAFLRAERYMDSDPDLANNLAVALARKSEKGERLQLWHRIPLFWHFRLSTRSRTMVAAVSFFMFWIFLTLQTLGARRWVRFLKMIAIILCVIFASSSATSIHQEANARRFVPALSAYAGSETAAP